MAPSAVHDKKRTKVARPTKKSKPFGDVPFRKFSLRSMSAAELRSLSETLLDELDLVRAMQRRTDAAEAAIAPMQRCASLLRRLTSHRHGSVFRESVVDAASDCDDVTRQPMNLGTVGRKLDSGEYTTPEAFAADVRLTFSSALACNSPSAPVHGKALTLSKLFEMEWEDIDWRLIGAVVHESETPKETETAATASSSPGQPVTSSEERVLSSMLSCNRNS